MLRLAAMNDPAQRLASYDDIVNAPPDMIAELIYGSLVLSPRPRPAHALATSGLGMSLGAPFQFGRGGPGGWWILDEPELHLNTNVLVPDLAGWRRERMPTMPEAAYFELTPDWICEVLSPATEARDRTEKLDIYAAAGVPWTWLINPDLRTLEILHNVKGRWMLEASHRGAALVRAQPFAAIELPLADLWPPSSPA
jgi:Uma2 family endonuclease